MTKDIFAIIQQCKEPSVTPPISTPIPITAHLKTHCPPFLRGTEKRGFFFPIST
jgi:hypothetical protein